MDVRPVVENAARRRGAAVMGIVNVTPDSFYDGGRYLSADDARVQIERLIAAGADILDLGAESSRPGATAVTTDEQRRRLDGPLRAAVELAEATGRVAVSVDTTDPAVARFAVDHGAHLLNDVSCLAREALADVAAAAGVPLVLMHTRGELGAMRGYSAYDEDAYESIVDTVLEEWRGARNRAVARGVPRDDVWLDPGLGFAKSARHSFQIMQRLHDFHAQEPGVPLLLGPGRKSFIAHAEGLAGGDPDVSRFPAAKRLGGTVAACLLGVQRGARIVRVHDVLEVAQALAVMQASSEGG